MSAEAVPEIVLDVKDVSLTLGGHRILHDLSMTVVNRVRPDVVTGQIVALLGPSGVGKTRLLRIIAGLDQPDAGTVRGPDGERLHAGEVGVVFQNYPLLRHRTVLGNLVVAGVMNGLRRGDAKERAHHLLQRFGLEARKDAFPVQLSGGQRQRAAIAQQLMKHKPLLILDEPFSGLDPAALNEVIKLLIEVAHMHDLNTLILITHDIRAALVASDTAFLLGRELDVQGRPTGSARVRRVVDLVEMGLAWRDGVENLPELAALERDVKDAFRGL